MDKRRKVLIVEDDGHFRNAVLRVLKIEDCRVRACGSLAEAVVAIQEMTFDLALVDIMLNGPVDMANTDGLQVLSRLKAADEGTRTFVVSGQAHDRRLIRDVLKEYGADDYIFKQDINRDFLLGLLQRALESRPPRAKNWNALIRVLAHDSDEADYVHNILQTLEFRGGLPLLQDRMLEVSQWLMPLLPPAGARKPSLQMSGAVSGTYWSKGQGCAVELILHGDNVDTEALDRHLAERGGTELHRQAKGGLTILVIARADLQRSAFTGG